MKTALNAWTVDKFADFEETFSAVKRAGFDGIELNIDKVGSSAHSLTMDFSDIDYKAIRSMSKKYDLPVVSISTSLTDSMSSDRTRHEAMRTLILKQIEAAKALGASGILTVPGGMSDSISLKASREAAIDFFKAIRSDIEAEGITVGLENVWNGFLMSPYDLTSMLDEIGSPMIGSYYDAGNVIAFAESEHWIEVLGERIKFVHVKDFLRERRTLKGGTFVDIAEGSARWDRIIPALREAGFDGYLTGEVNKSDPSMSYDDYYAKVARQIASITAL